VQSSADGTIAVAQAHIAEETMMRQRKECLMRFGKLLCLGLLLDVHFISSSPVEPSPVYTVEGGTKHVQNSGGEG
jgi:hypothetical protein